MKQFTKKPLTISAIQMPDYGEEPSAELLAMAADHGWRGEHESLIIPTLEGELFASPRDWIIKGIKGEFYPCKPDIFEATHEPAINLEEKNFSFGIAIAQLKRGYRVARTGWNGKGMWIALTPGSVFDSRCTINGHAAKLRADELQADLPHDGTENVIELLPHIDMRTAGGSMVVGWLASQTDVLADDWFVVD